MKHSARLLLSALILGLAVLSAPLALAQTEEPQTKVRCSASCGLFLGTNLVSIPLFSEVTSPEDGLADLKKQCSARDPKGTLFGAIQYASGGRQRLVPLGEYSDINLNAWACSEIAAVPR